MSQEEKEPAITQSSLIQSSMRELAGNIKASNILPVGSERNNFNACFPAFPNGIKPYSDGILKTMSTLLAKEGIKQSMENCDNEEKIDLVVDGINKMLDRVRDNLSIFNGVKKNPYNDTVTLKENKTSGSWNINSEKLIEWKTVNKKRFHYPKNIEKPQLKFEPEIDNTTAPFKPNLGSKPNTIKPLAIYLERDVNGCDHYCHPYMHELRTFQIPDRQLQKFEPIVPLDMGSRQLMFIDTEESLAHMIEDLKNEKELAVDLEYHSYRSFQGFTCLLQISSRRNDYIVDALPLRCRAQVLNELLTNPEIVKVLHGASSDVLWLQKDLSLYLVNMFDTHLASMALEFPRLSLSFLLKHYCNVDADKRYQLFDWRIRPLPAEAITYARSDTHYLLYIYDHLRNSLLDKANGSTSMLEAVYARSTDLCGKRYEKTFDANGHLTLYKQSKQTFENRQMHALKLLYQWRDRIAREKDESTGYVLPNHMLLQLAELLPREMQGILACCNPVPPLVRQNLAHLHHLIMEARSKPVNKMSINVNGESRTTSKMRVVSKLRCPHDFSYHDDFRDNLTTLLDGTDIICLSQEKAHLQLSVLESTQSQEECPTHGVNYQEVTFVSPFERYSRTLKYLKVQSTTETSKNRSLSESKESSLVTGNEKFTVTNACDEMDQRRSYCETNSIHDTNKRKPFAAETANRLQCHNALSLGAVNTEVCQLTTATKTSDYSTVTSETCQQKRMNVQKSKEGNKKKTHCDVQDRDKNFTPFDYSTANYRKFGFSESRNLKKLLGTKITFNVNKKQVKKNRKFQF